MVAGRRAYKKSAIRTPAMTTTAKPINHRRMFCRSADGADDGAGHGVGLRFSAADICSAFFSASRIELNAFAPHRFSHSMLVCDGREVTSGRPG
jgi:hypothetical protein